jgi:hypothetical protein
MAAAKDSGRVNIHGKEYETVASRVARFRAEHGDKYGIITDVVNRNDEQVVVKAMIIRYGEVLRDKDGAYTDQAVIATGYAEESRSSSSINRTSALENAETSAIGRALANFGLAGTEYASADEVANAIKQRQEPTKASNVQKAKIAALLRQAGIPNEDMPKVVRDKWSLDLKDLSETEATQLILWIKDEQGRAA